ncbi:hypothetical protein [Lacibacter sediminis]|uniref:Uncharacterized protein n=1 Tax=Lacibacter sediminis TaxID=2760713 RepID=A0A7G5XLZ8_9BACT|nr:hypothetical protein [Lacibacter sediminis]QNA46501.1 hypothetical protein H4075_10120 [Lacibacter sediminis]
MRFTSIAMAALLLQLFIFSGCKKNTQPQPQTPIDISTIKISDFRFSEVNYSSIDIDHPTVVNGIETEPGRITIKIPRGTTGLQLTPLATNFQKQGFSIAPQLGVKTDFLFKELLYSITSSSDPQKKINYRVTVQEEPVAGTLAITNFRFLKSMNAQLSEDISAVQIIHESSSIGKIHVIVPAGTHFGALTPVIDHNGEQLRYTQNAFEVPANSATIYPHTGLSIDFTYPKGFYIAVKRGEEVKTYSVIVDVEKPIVFVNDHVIISGLRSGITQTVKVSELYNRGNRPISITQIAHSDHIPYGSDLRTFAAVPSMGLLPGEKTDVTTTITEGFFFSGTYEVKASMRPSFFQEPEMQSFLQPSFFNLKVQLQ